MAECRFCKKSLNQTFLDLGVSPLSNSFLTTDDLKKKELLFPLHVYVCTNCLLVQLEEFETPKQIFSNYAYFSSYSTTWLDHARNYVELMLKKFPLDQNSQIIEIASNDGYLLQYFKQKGFLVLGIEPAANVAKVAEEKGIQTLVRFFGTQIAKELSTTEKRADLIIGNNVLAHVPNLNDFVAGLKILLKPIGVITLEFPHLLRLIKDNQFDTIYHEHFSYFSLITSQKIFSSHGLVIFDVQEVPTHGGSLRIYITHTENRSCKITQDVARIIENEEQFGLMNLSTYRNFQIKVEASKQKIQHFFKEAKKKKKKVVCYGAPAKGNTLLNFCKINSEYVEYTVDLNPHKQGLYLPGTRIPIKSPDKVFETKPDYLVILPWNLKDEIMKQMNRIRDWDGKFVTLIPDVRVYK